jgi:hypothetical protein
LFAIIFSQSVARNDDLAQDLEQFGDVSMGIYEEMANRALKHSW